MKDGSQSDSKRVHIESLFLMARYDSEFKQQLLEDRETALRESGIPFTPGEVMLLEGINREKLEQTIEEFSVPGITKKSLSNWRAAAAVILLLTSVLFAGPLGTTACRSGQVETKKMITDGWVDEDTIRVKVMAEPKRGLTNIIQRKGTAKEAALIMAQKRVLEKFTPPRLEGAAGMAEFNSTGIAVARELGGFVKGGTIIKEKYDKDQNCEIVYEVKMRGLKKRVMMAPNY
ncbi:MAG: hypothetical protein GY754_45490 [bacterium]|nr:hypothetical protein [bacterium]